MTIRHIKMPLLQQSKENCSEKDRIGSIIVNRMGKTLNRTTDSPKCRTCEKMVENVSHLVSECNELAQNEYKKHDKREQNKAW